MAPPAPNDTAPSAGQDLLLRVQSSAYEVGLKLAGAIAIWVIGSWVIGMIERTVTRALHARKIEETLIRYISAAVSVGLKIALAVGVLGYLGVQTTTRGGTLSRPSDFAGLSARQPFITP